MLFYRGTTYSVIVLSSVFCIHLMHVLLGAINAYEDHVYFCSGQ